MSELAMVFYKHVKHNSHCMVCGSAEHVTFHHIKPADKVTEILKVARWGDMVATVSELNKTIPICEHDHQRIHKGNLRGWLDGHFDNGRPSTAEYAYQYSPYLNWLARKRPEVMLQFYRDYMEKNHRALWPVFNAAGIALPRSQRLVVVEAECTQAQDALGSTGGQVASLPRTTSRQRPTGIRNQAAANDEHGYEQP